MSKRKKTDLFNMSWATLSLIFLSIVGSFFAFRALFGHNYFSTEAIAAPFYNAQLYNNILLWLHILLALPPFLIGPFLFIPELRNNNLWWHRQFGKIYVICCIASGLTGVVLASAFGAPWAAAGFCTLGTLWIITSFTAYKYARKRNFVKHRQWMLRSYSLTFAFFTVRLWAYLLLYLFPDWSMVLQMSVRSWIAWAPNLLIAQIYIVTTTHQGKFIGTKKLKEKISAMNPRRGATGR